MSDNPLKDDVEIIVDGKRRFLRYETNSMIELEAETGKTRQEILQKLWGAYEQAAKVGQGGEMPSQEYLRQFDLSTKELRALFWAGLLHEDRSLTVEAAGDLMERVGDDRSGIFREWYISMSISQAFFVRSLPGWNPVLREKMEEMRRIVLAGPKEILRNWQTGEASEREPSSPELAKSDFGA